MSLDPLLAHPPVYLTLALVLGLVVGSFLNVVIHRLPRMMEREWQAQCRELAGEEPPAEERPFNLVTPRSHCPHCDHPIRALENIPLLSWLWLRGRCAHCGAGISPRYPLVELATGLLSLAVLWQLGPTPAAAAGLALTWALVAATFIDLDTMLLPDTITLPLLWLGLAVNLWGTFAPLEDAVVGAMAGYLTLWTVYHGFRLLTGKEGMGYGDFKLLAALGAWLGWQVLPLVIVGAAAVGAAVGIALILFRAHGRETPIPFGPYLAASGWIALVWGEGIIDGYLAWSGLPTG
jgi:leader peptidase (prepilin peptidase)/N-methyltransferase